MGFYALKRMRERQRQRREEAARVAASEDNELREEDILAKVKNHRRYLRFKVDLAAQQDEPDLADTWVSRLAQEAPGTPLPDVDGEPFPHTAELAAHVPPYVYLEDLAGADEAELRKVKGIGKAGAAKIIAALPSE